MDMNDASANLLMAFATYAIGSASPGPSNFAVMATAMNVGRKHSLMLALGVVTGSGIWGLLAAFGLAAVISTYSIALIFMKVVGGLYLLWLASKSARSALSGNTLSKATSNGINASYRGTYRRGVAMHLTNPKAIFVWLSIVSLALPVGAKTMDALEVVLVCEVIGLIVFGGYALLFSTSIARNNYLSLRRFFESALAILFSYAGIRMLASKSRVIATLEFFNEKIIFRGIQHNPEGKSFAIIIFPDLQAAYSWRDSKQYQALISLRDEAAIMSFEFFGSQA